MTNTKRPLSLRWRNWQHRYITPLDRCFVILLVIALLFSVVYRIVNGLGANYSGIHYLPQRWIMITPIMIALFGFSLVVFKHQYNVARFVHSYTLYFLIFAVLSYLTGGIQLTPFSTIDSNLAQLDRMLGFSSIDWINWTYAHPWFASLMHKAYDSIIFELAFLPFIMMALRAQDRVYLYFLAIIISFLVGTTIYYFLPTTGLTHIFSSPHFAQIQHDTWIKFHEIHHYLPITTTSGGMIAFPSFHVIWAVLLAYCAYDRKWLFYPLLIWNTLMILATVCLGWHYLVDVIGGLVLAYFSILMAQYLYQKVSQSRLTWIYRLSGNQQMGNRQQDQNRCNPATTGIERA